MKQVLQAWHYFDEIVQKVERSLIAFGLAVIILAGMLNIVRRLTGFNEYVLTGVVLKQFTLWLGLLGASVATASSEHLNVDALSRLLKKRGHDIHKVVIGVVCVVFSAYFTYLAYHFFQFQGEKLKSAFVGGGKFAWLWVVIFPASFAMMTLRYLFQTIEYGGILFSPEIATETAEAAKEADVQAEESADSADASEAQAASAKGEDE